MPETFDITLTEYILDLLNSLPYMAFSEFCSTFVSQSGFPQAIAKLYHQYVQISGRLEADKWFLILKPCQNCPPWVIEGVFCCLLLLMAINKIKVSLRDKGFMRHSTFWKKDVMKINRQGQAKVLTEGELKDLFTVGLITTRDRLLFGICLYTGCRIGEACSLKWRDIVEGAITFRIENTKTKSSRTVAMSPALQGLLAEYGQAVERERFASVYLFRGKRVGSHLCPSMAHKILKGATERIGVMGVSTHSFRRTALTMMCRKGVNLRVIQKISGHKNLNVLAHYLEVSEQEKEAALAMIEF